MKLDQFDNHSFSRGRSVFIEGLWRLFEGVLINSWLPGSAWRVWLLRWFGAEIGRRVTIKPHVRIKFPWKLKIGDSTWIGESVWIDNLAEVTIGDNCCISQGVYLCTGNHRWDSDHFDLAVSPITIREQCWIGACSKVAPGVVCEPGSVLTMGSLAATHLEAWQVYSGFPATKVTQRVEKA